MTQPPIAHHTTIAHHTHGRTRLRVARPYRDKETLAQVQLTLQQVPGVRRVEVNPTAGSVIIHHDPDTTRLEDVSDALEDGLGFFLSIVPPRERAQAAADVSVVAHAIRRQFHDLDAAVRRATGGWIDLKMLVPVVFLGAAVVQVTVTEGSWAAVPPYLLLYYAFDTYMKFHELAPHHRPAGAAVLSAATALPSGTG